jgi:hypothetical protein
MKLHDHIDLADTTSRWPRDFDQNSNYLSKNDKVLMSTACPANSFGKIWIAQKQGLPIYKHFALKWVRQWVKMSWK